MFDMVHTPFIFGVTVPTKKYNIDIDAEHDPQSLWELMIKYIDTQGPKSHHATLGKLKRSYKRKNGKKRKV